MLRAYLIAFAPSTPFKLSSQICFSNCARNTFRPSSPGVDSNTIRTTSKRVKTFPRSCASLVDASWLDKALTSMHPPAVIDVRGSVRKCGDVDADGFQRVEYVAALEEYFAGHVPTASFLDWRTIFTFPIDGFVEALEERGVTQDRHVCVYDNGDMLFATRAWFSLLAAGCKTSKVHVLQGGWSSWDAGNYSVSLETTCPLKAYTPFYVEPEENTHRRPEAMSIFAVDLRQRLETFRDGLSDNLFLVDARSERQFTGQERRGRRAGHIANAVSIPYRSLLNENGVGFRGDSELRSTFQKAGVPALKHDFPDSPADGPDVVAYCNGGVASTAVLFALARCGFPVDRLVQYDGSMNEWANLDDTYPMDY